MKRPEFGGLTQDDYNIITGNGALNDAHIMKAQNILHEQFPLIDGFLSTSLGMVGQLPVMKSEFIQILHTSKFHYVCVSSLSNSSKNTADINLYDSLYRGITPETKKQIVSLLFSTEKNQCSSTQRLASRQ